MPGTQVIHNAKLHYFTVTHLPPLQYPAAYRLRVKSGELGNIFY